MTPAIHAAQALRGAEMMAVALCALLAVFLFPEKTKRTIRIVAEPVADFVTGLLYVVASVVAAVLTIPIYGFLLFFGLTLVIAAYKLVGVVLHFTWG